MTHSSHTPTDRLDEMQDRYAEWHEDRGDHTPAPVTETWSDADHPDESMEHCIVRNDVPALITALRAVLAVHWYDPENEGCGDCRTFAAPCDTQRAIAAALGEARS